MLQVAAKLTKTQTRLHFLSQCMKTI